MEEQIRTILNGRPDIRIVDGEIEDIQANDLPVVQLHRGKLDMQGVINNMDVHASIFITLDESEINIYSRSGDNIDNIVNDIICRFETALLPVQKRSSLPQSSFPFKWVTYSQRRD